MGESELFNFFDDNIPKIENTKIYDPVEKPNNDIDIDNIATMKITPELLSTLMQKIKNKEFNEEQSNKILNILKSHLNEQSNAPTPDTTTTNIVNTNPNYTNPNPNMFMPNPYFNLSNMPMPLINPLNNNLNNSVNPLLDPAKRFYGAAESKMNMIKYRTKPCRNYHGPNGCMRGDNCHFIHDPSYIGKEIPNFNINNYKTEEESKESTAMVVNMNTNVNPTPQPVAGNMPNVMNMFPRPGMPMNMFPRPGMPMNMFPNFNPYMMNQMNMMRPGMNMPTHMQSEDNTNK
jgi:hypothetical protein